MIVEMDFLDHWKTQALIALLDDDCAPLYLLRIWAHCQSRKTHGLPVGSLKRVSMAVAAIAKYPVREKKTAEEFFNALVEAGFLDVENDKADPEILIPTAHDWEATNASLVSSWSNGCKGGRPKKENPRDNPAKTHGITQEKPSRNPDTENRNPLETDREEKRREDERREEGEVGDSRPAIPESVSKIVQGYFEKFRGVHSECERVSEMQFVAALRASNAFDAPCSVVEEALEAFNRQCCSVTSFRPQTALGKFENYLKRAMADVEKKINGDAQPEKVKRLRV